MKYKGNTMDTIRNPPISDTSTWIFDTFEIVFFKTLPRSLQMVPPVQKWTTTKILAKCQSRIAILAQKTFFLVQNGKGVEVSKIVKNGGLALILLDFVCFHMYGVS